MAVFWAIVGSIWLVCAILDSILESNLPRYASPSMFHGVISAITVAPIMIIIFTICSPALILNLIDRIRGKFPHNENVQRRIKD